MLLYFIFCLGLSAQNQKKVALVIGNASYDKSPLKNPINDAEDVSAKLESLGFTVLLAKDCKTKREMRLKIHEFCELADQSEAGVFYYSGHGIQLSKEGSNFLIPTNAEMLSETDVSDECIALDYILNRMNESNIKMKIAIIDACRDNPFRTWYRGGVKGLSTVIDAPSGTFIAFATSGNDVAADGVNRNSPFTNAFLLALNTVDLEINNVFTEVKRLVKIDTNGTQRPWISNDLSEKFYFGENINTNVGLNNEKAVLNANYKVFNANGIVFRMIKIDGDSLRSGYSPSSNEIYRETIILNSYYIGETEVSQSLWEAVMDEIPSHHKGPNFPVDGISWEKCNEFIRRLNIITGQHFRLPFDIEWEYAAKGGKYSNGYKYSGSNNLEDVGWYTKNSKNNVPDLRTIWGSSSNKCRTHQIASKKPNEIGIYDMSGNVSEWCYRSDALFSHVIGSTINNYDGITYNYVSHKIIPKYVYSSKDEYPTSNLEYNLNEIPLFNDDEYFVCLGGSWCTESKYCISDRWHGFIPDINTFSTGFRLCLVIE